MKNLFIPVIAGTTRKDRVSIHAARLVYEVGKTIEGIEVSFVDPMDYVFHYDGNDEINKDPRYSDITSRADAFFIITPEYNHSYPGSLKKLLDSELKNYVHKAVAFGGVSSGQWGGVRAIEALVQSVREMGLVPTYTDVQFPKVQEIFDQSGKLQDDAYIRRITRAYTELIWMAKSLRYGRENFS